MQTMQVTEVEMLLSHASFEEMVRMHDWLNRHNPRFLFDGNARLDFGFQALNADWRREDIRIDSAGAVGGFIDFRFTLRTYPYPHALALILRRNGWRVNGRWRTMLVDPATPWEDLHFSGEWTRNYEADFPHGWSPGADRRRQEGGRDY